jgi:heat-inducible transcriptional repressor
METQEKRSAKQIREERVLLGLVKEFIKTAKPVGSNTLKEAGFDDLSSATIRNYFANLEEQDYLTQQHISGGRIPTEKAYRFYAHQMIDEKSKKNPFSSLALGDTKEIATYLQGAANVLSDEAKLPVFVSAPRFDHDVIVDIKLTPIDNHRILIVLITDFGLVKTELMLSAVELSSPFIQNLLNYFHHRLFSQKKPTFKDKDQEEAAKELYNETCVRFVAGYGAFTEEDIYKTGFSHLLTYPDFQDTAPLSSALCLFESKASSRQMLRDCRKKNELIFWVGSDLIPYTKTPDTECAVIAIPYFVNTQAVGAFALLGPYRMPYETLFPMMQKLSEVVSDTLTKSLYTYKISFRQPHEGHIFLQKEEQKLLGK